MPELRRVLPLSYLNIGPMCSEPVPEISSSHCKHLFRFPSITKGSLVKSAYMHTFLHFSLELIVFHSHIYVHGSVNPSRLMHCLNSPSLAK